MQTVGSKRRTLRRWLHDSVLKRDDHRCQDCGTSKWPNIHHIVPISVEPDLQFVEDNLITLCKTCHRRLHGFIKVSHNPKG